MFIEGPITPEVMRALREHSRDRWVREPHEVAERVLREGEFASLRRREPSATQEAARPPRTLQEILAAAKQNEAETLEQARASLEAIAV